MRIGLIDADLMDNGTRHPNLALMKLAGYHLDQGDQAALIYEDYEEVHRFDKVYLSKVFSFTQVPEWVLTLPHVTCGGTGFFEDGGENLPDEIEHHKPYYDLYKAYVEKQLAEGKQRSIYSDYMDYSIGFTSRGCFRKCSFCVNKKYNHAFLHSPVSEFFDEKRPYIYLWDDNILALPEWEQVMDELEATGRSFQFRQGIDIRLMNDQKAKRLIHTHYQGDFTFAFDRLAEQKIIMEKVQLWKRYSAKVCKMYVICAYQAQDETDVADVFERIHILMRYGSIPYIMRYEAYKQSPLRGVYIELARWCNQPNFFKKKSFREFCVSNQAYKRDQSSRCSAYQAMLDFEEQFPEIAAKYFDLRYDQENYYMRQYGYGRKYANKPRCTDCLKKGICWGFYLRGQCDPKAVLRAYLTKELDLECLRYGNAECGVDPLLAAAGLTRLLLNLSLKDLIQLIRQSESREEVTKENIPQLSKVEAGLHVPYVLHEQGQSLSFEELGSLLKHFPASSHTVMSNTKYGENHAKLAALLDLTVVEKIGGRAQVSPSQLGRYYLELPPEEQKKLTARLCLRIPILQNFVLSDCNPESIDEDLNVLSQETKRRRRPSVDNLVEWLKKQGADARV